MEAERAEAALGVVALVVAAEAAEERAEAPVEVGAEAARVVEVVVPQAHLWVSAAALRAAALQAEG